eukprot:6508088-Alexandrium_andersonii.AAC.1
MACSSTDVAVVASAEAPPPATSWVVSAPPTATPASPMACSSAGVAVAASAAARPTATCWGPDVGDAGIGMDTPM